MSRYSAQTLRVPASATRVVYGGTDPQRHRPGPDDERRGVLLRDARLARELGTNARDAVLERCTWDACARRCVDAYRELAMADTS